MTAIMKPIVGINGTAREELVTQRMGAIRAIEAAMTMLVATRPHGRDYEGESVRYHHDLDIYKARFAVLDKLRNEIEEEALAIHGG